MQAGPGLWLYKLQDAIPLLRKLPHPLQANEALLLLVLFAASQQAGSQVWRTLTGDQVGTCTAALRELAIAVRLPKS